MVVANEARKKPEGPKRQKGRKEDFLGKSRENFLPQICYGETLSEYLSNEYHSTKDKLLNFDGDQSRFFNYHRYLIWRRKGEHKKKEELKTEKLSGSSLDISDSSASSTIRKQRVTNRHLFSRWSALESFEDSLSSGDPLSKSNLLLKTRLKQFIVRKSPIHSWGLYASEDIPAGSFVTAYLGEKIKSPCLALLREKEWLQYYNIESSYLFKVSPEIYIDATMMGASSRFLNHSCDPNLYANIDQEEKMKSVLMPIWDPTGAQKLTLPESEQNSPPNIEDHLPASIHKEIYWKKISYVQEDKGIYFYAKWAIATGEELTYDYKFPREKEDKIPCHCQSKNCHGTLN